MENNNASWEGRAMILPGGIAAYVDGIKSTCDHVFDGEGILDFWDSDVTMTESEYLALPDEEKEKLRIKTGQATCSKCGAAWFDCNNPFMMF